MWVTVAADPLCYWSPSRHFDFCFPDFTCLVINTHSFMAFSFSPSSPVKPCNNHDWWCYCYLQHCQFETHVTIGGNIVMQHCQTFGLMVISFARHLSCVLVWSVTGYRYFLNHATIHPMLQRLGLPAQSNESTGRQWLLHQNPPSTMHTRRASGLWSLMV